MNDVAVSVFETVRRGNTVFPFTRDETDEGGFARPIVATLGTREPFWAMAVPAFGNTDHLVFNDGRVGVPAVSLDNWPDPYIHSSDDDLWQVDPTRLERNAFIVAATAYTVASLGESNVGRLAALLQAGRRQGLDGTGRRRWRDLWTSRPDLTPLDTKMPRCFSRCPPLERSLPSILHSSWFPRRSR